MNDRPRTRSPGARSRFPTRAASTSSPPASRGMASRSSRPAARLPNFAKLAPMCAKLASSPAFPEMMDGRVKTLHPKVHGGLLGVRDNPDHAAAMEEHGIAPIDLVVVNLYPFLDTVMSGADRDTIIENIDIGGPSMVRSAAKNHAHVAIVTDPADYAALLGEMDANNGGDDARAPQEARGQSLRADRCLRFDHLAMVRLRRPAASAGPKPGPARASSRCRFATARTRTSRRRSTCRSARMRAASPRRSKSRARSSATTISTTPTPRWSSSRSFGLASPRSSSSSMPIPAVWRPAVR